MSTVPHRRVTQADVARLAGVSQATVSHVLGGENTSRARVSESTRQEVLNAIRVTGYSVNAAAQRLAGGRNRIIGVFTYEPVFPRDTNDFYHPFLLGLEREAESMGCDLLMFTSAPTHNGRRSLLADGAHRLGVADGCVLLGRHDDKQELAELFTKGFPFAFVGRRESEAGPIPYAAADYTSATRNLVDHLLGLGHQRVAYLGDLGGDEFSRDRLDGYREAMRVADRRPVMLDGTTYTPAEALDMLRHNDVTAAVVAPTGLISDLHRLALERGLRIPGDLSLAQLGDPERSAPDDPEWTSFKIPREEMGALALHVLDAVITGQVDPADPATMQRTLPCTLVPGTTSGPPPP